jgi:hypothetical protein
MMRKKVIIMWMSEVSFFPLLIEPFKCIVCDPLSETPSSFNQVYSMITYTTLSVYLYQIATGENRVGSQWRWRERKRVAD